MPGNRISQKAKLAKNSGVDKAVVDLTEAKGESGRNESHNSNDETNDGGPKSSKAVSTLASKSAAEAIDPTASDENSKAFVSKRKRKTNPLGSVDNTISGDNAKANGSQTLQPQRNFHSSLGRRKPPQRPKLKKQQQQQPQRQSTLSFASKPSSSSSSQFSHGHVFRHKVLPRSDLIRTNYQPSMQKILETVFGLKSLRPNLQPAAIKCAIQGTSQMIVMATGGGKSLCYQLPACLLGGVTVVISPLLALMKDQTEALLAKDIPAACINSSQTEKQNRTILETLVPALYPKSLAAKAKATAKDATPQHPAVLLYVTPESIQTERMRAVLKTLYKEDRLALFAVDEAHCLSTWVSCVGPNRISCSLFVVLLSRRIFVEGAYECRNNENLEKVQLLSENNG
jgi:hypothetical protein